MPKIKKEPSKYILTSEKFIFNVKTYYKEIFKNRLFLKYLVYFFFFQLSFEWMNTFNIYYFKYSINQEYFFSIYAFTIIAQLLSAASYPKLNHYLNSSQIYYLSAFLSSVGMLILFGLSYFDPSNALLMFIAASIKQSGSGLFMVSATTELANIIQIESQNKQFSNTASLTAIKLFMSKFSTALSGLGVGFCLFLSHYVSNQIQSPETAHAIGIYALIIPIFMILISCLFYRYYKKTGNVF